MVSAIPTMNNMDPPTGLGDFMDSSLSVSENAARAGATINAAQHPLRADLSDNRQRCGRSSSARQADNRKHPLLASVHQS